MRQPYGDGWDEAELLFQPVPMCEHRDWEQVMGLRGWIARKLQHQVVYRCTRCGMERAVQLDE